jgi:hypothetical protein
VLGGGTVSIIEVEDCGNNPFETVPIFQTRQNCNLEEKMDFCYHENHGEDLHAAV